MSGVGTLNEKSLHAQLKAWYRRPGDRLEAPVGRHVIDIVRDGVLIEIQTRNVSAMRAKLDVLLGDHDVRVVFPVPAEKRIIKVDGTGAVVSRRRSPRRGTWFDLFGELVSIPHLIDHPRFSFHGLLIVENEIRAHVTSGSRRRRGWRTEERMLDGVVDELLIESTSGLIEVLPPLPEEWTTADLAAAANVPRRRAQQAAYTLRRAGRAAVVDKRGNSLVYRYA